jgi:phospholipase/carboxylesterase
MSLQYLVREPKVKKAQHPLILLLHGYGSNAQDLFSFASELPEDAYVVSAEAPYSLMYNAYAWYAINFDADEKKFSDVGQARISREIVMRLIEELQEKYNIDAQNVTLMGFSQGAILSYAVAVSYPEKIKKVVAMSGYFNEEIAVDDYFHQDFSKLQFFISHGLMDEVIPVSWAEKSVEKINSMNIQNVFKTYSVGHGVAPQNFRDILDWLKATDI